MAILTEVSTVAAKYDTRTIVPCCMPLVFPVAEEVVKTGYANAGRPDAYRKDDVRFLSDDQFAYTAGKNATDGLKKKQADASSQCGSDKLARAKKLTDAGELEHPEFSYLAPQAVGNSWYPNSFLAPRDPFEEAVEYL